MCSARVPCCAMLQLTHRAVSSQTDSQSMLLTDGLKIASNFNRLRYPFGSSSNWAHILCLQLTFVLVHGS